MHTWLRALGSLNVIRASSWRLYELILLYSYSQELSHVSGIWSFIPVLTRGHHFSLSWAIQIQSIHSLPSYFLKAILILSFSIRTQEIRSTNPAIPVVIPLPQSLSLSFEFRPWKPDKDSLSSLPSLTHSLSTKICDNILPLRCCVRLHIFNLYLRTTQHYMTPVSRYGVKKCLGRKSKGWQDKLGNTCLSYHFWRVRCDTTHILSCEC